MRLRTALNEYKRNRDGRFPAECRTTDGAFSAHGDRLVYVNPEGGLRDYSSALSGLYGIDRARLGIETDSGTQWFDEFATVRQHYYGETNVVETEYDADGFTVHQYDLTLGRAHLTHVELRGAIPPNAELTAFLTFAPGGQESKVGRLIHDEAGPNDTSAVEVFHRTEHDYVTASTGIIDVRGQIPERFDEILSEDAYEFPREAVINRFEDTHLSGDVVINAPLEQTGRAAKTTLITQLSDHDTVDREEALADLRQCAQAHRTADAIREAGRERAAVSVPDSAPNSNVVRSDLRALALLHAPSGGHVAAPEFDPFYAHSGGYGYTWFRDEAETGRNLLAADERLDLELDESLIETAQFLCRTQEADGSWPHRVWAIDSSLAPGWAHGRIEGNNDDYQADQTAYAVTFLAELLTKRGDQLDDELAGEMRAVIDRAVGVLDETLADDGLPESCQNLWENMSGRFTHTAATYLTAYATVATAPLDDELRAHAHEQADTVFEAFDRLWSETREAYGIRLNQSGKLDDRIDSGTFAIVDAFVAYDNLIDDLDSDSLDRLTDHVQSLFDALYREPSEGVAGLARFEGDTWRAEGQQGEKIWSVSTGWGATAATDLGVLLAAYDREDDAEECFEQAGTLYEQLLPDGPLATEAGYLAEQVFDDGTVDGATPLGWSHSLRLRATATLREQNALPLSSPAPSGPGGRPRWTTGEKYGVATVADHGEDDASKVWFTLTEGALTEVRFPRVDLMNLRTVDFVIADADEDSTYTARTHNETRRDDDTETIERRVEPTDDDALLFRHVIAEQGDGRGHEWTLSVEYAIDPDHDAILADVSFESSDTNEYELYSVADISLTNTGTRDRGYRLGERGNYHLAARDAEAYDTGAEALLTDEEGDIYSVAAAMTTSSRFDWATVGAAGSAHLAKLFSEGEEPLPNDRLDDDNIVLAGRVGTGETITETVGLGFADDADTAAALGEAQGALNAGYEDVRSAYADTWQAFLADKEVPQFITEDEELYKQYKSCLMALRAVEDKTYIGAGIASPSVPWGEAVTADEPKGYGYNFVWSRDLYQVFTVFEAIGDHKTATDALQYIFEYQQDDEGFIPQNTYVNGLTRWGGEQIDNISFPLIMAYQLAENDITFDDVNYDYINVKRSADYVTRNGPATAQERWEEEAGYSPSSIAAEVAGLVCAGDLALDEGETADALVWLALADEWAQRVEDWCATETGTELHTNTPYYVRVTRDGNPEAGHLRTLANAGPTLDEREIIDGGFLELTRLGIKPADDQIIENSVTEVDNTIRVDTPQGPAFYRYNGDGYGERALGEKGAPWSVQTKGKGRLWPIFTGERGEYELLAGTDEGELAPYNLLRTMAGFANSGRMIAEQVWDRHIDNEYNWQMGEGTGAATPLAWSMAQFVRLAHGIESGEPVETPTVVDERYRSGAREAAPTLSVETTSKTTKTSKATAGGTAATASEETVTVTGETDAAVVALKATDEAVATTVEDGEFELTLPLDGGERTVTVAAASDEDLSTAGTTVEEITI